MFSHMKIQNDYFSTITVTALEFDTEKLGQIEFHLLCILYEHVQLTGKMVQWAMQFVARGLPARTLPLSISPIIAFQLSPLQTNS